MKSLVSALLLISSFQSSSSSHTQLWRAFPIRYDIDAGVPESLIEEALAEWTRLTCVRFERWPGPAASAVDTVATSSQPDLSFVQASSCYAHIGRVYSENKEGELQESEVEDPRQLVGIAEACATKGVLLHEIGHSLGLHHTHTRRDRDAHVRLRMENVRSRAYLTDFSRRARRSVTDSIPYDLGSLLHYAPTTFSRSAALFTVLPRDALYVQTIGQRSEISFYDAKAINTAYCADACSHIPSSPCLNNGYPDQRNCSACTCPSGLSGRHCEKLHNDEVCPSLFERIAGEDWESIRYGVRYEEEEEVRYEDGIRYEGGQRRRCTWSVQAPPDTVVEFEVVDVQSSSYPGAACSSDYVEVKYSEDLGITGARFCHFGTKRSRTTSVNRILVLARAEGGQSALTFEVRYRAVRIR